MATSTRKQQQAQHFQYGHPQAADMMSAADTMSTADTRSAANQQPPAARPVARQGGRRKWPWILAAALVAAWFLPTLVVHSPLLGWAINKAAGDLNGTVHVRSASVGWLSPIAAEGIEVRDAKGQSILQASALQGSKSLLSLLTNFSSVGKLKLEKPRLTVSLRRDGSNLEEALAKYLAPSDKSSSRIGIEAEIVDGTVEVIDEVNNARWNMEKFNLAFAMPAESDKPIELKIQSVISDLRQQANLDLAVLIRPDMSGTCRLETDALPLAMFDALLKRAMPHSAVAGRLAAKLDAAWSAAGRTDIQGQLSAAGLDFVLPSGGDRMAFDRMELKCRVAGQNNVYVIEPTTLDCDLGKLTLSGNLDFSRGAEGLVDRLFSQDYELQGTLDLARLAAMIPKALMLRENTQITSGAASVQLSSRKTAQGMVWCADIDAGNLRARTESGDFAWDRPIAVNLSAHETPQGVVFDQVKCESDFLAIEGSGTPDNLEASGSFNLKTLADQLGRLIKLGDVKLSGDGWSRFHWNQLSDGRFETKTELQVRAFQLEIPDAGAWSEENLMAIAQGKGKGQWNNLSAARLDEATANVRTATDKLDVELTQPVVSLGSAKWPLHMEVSGKIEALLPRLAAVAGLTGYRGAGGYQAIAECSGSSEAIEVRDLRLAVAPLRFECDSFTLNEPRIEGSLSGSFGFAQRKLTLDALKLTSSAATVEGRGLTLAMPAKGRGELAGALSCKADMARVADWFADATQPRSWSLGGVLGGTLTFQPSTFGYGASLEAEIANLAVATAGNKPAVEPRVKLAAQGDYNTTSGEIQLQKASLASQAVQADASGNVTTIDKQSRLAFKGNLGCDFAALCGLLRPYLGQNIDIAGTSSAPFAFEGPIDFTAGRGNAAVQWQRAYLYGFPLSGAEARLTLAEGRARIEPLSLPVSQGRVNLAPVVQMETRDLFLPKGVLAERIQITRPMCDAALMYIAPVLADVADAKGAFSIELDGARIPLLDPAASDIGGRFIVHDIEVGVSPLIEALVSLFGRVTPGKLRREAVVPFRMVNGRVYHQDLELIFPEVTIRTHGSVGIDQTIELLAEMPVPQKWADALGKSALADSMRGQTISVPVGGTLRKPQVDPRVLEQFTKKAVRGAAENLLENEINKGLDRLLAPR